MKKFKILIYSLLLIISVSIFSNTVKAIDEAYLQAKDYIILVDGKDNSKEIEKFLTICKDENKDAYFNDGIYILKESITLVDGVSLIGAEQTIFRGINGDYQVNIFDGENTKDITIKNIIFDNVTIYSQNANSTNWSIEENIFINAKKVDINIDSGLKPDSNNKNGGELTGYYILKSKTNGNISSNLFLRDENSLGRGIAVYKSYDFTINDNYFGLIADIDNSIVSDKTKALKEKVIKLDSYNSNSNQGYFMTCINVVSGDTNTLIKGNHFSLNKDIVEVEYERGEGATLGYNRDHIIYAKEYNNLVVVGNYFKGQNKNQDGGLKIRNGEKALVYRNIFEDSMILFYIQTGSNVNIFNDTYCAENILLNQDFSTLRLNESLDGYELAKYPTIDFSIYFRNYISSSTITNLTVENNKFISLGLKNEEMRIEGEGNYSNINILNNTNYLGEEMDIRAVCSLGDGTNKYIYPDLELYNDIDVYSLLNLDKASIKINEGKLVGDNLYLNNKKYNNEIINLDTDYELLETTNSTTYINALEYSETALEIPSIKYCINQFYIPSKLDIKVYYYDEVKISNYLDLSMFSSLACGSFNSSYVDISLANNDITIKPKIVGNTTFNINCGGLLIKVNLTIDDGLIEDFNVNDLNINLGETKKINIDYEEGCLVDFTFDYYPYYLIIDDNFNITPLASGIHSVKVVENNSKITKCFNVVVSSDLNINIKEKITINDNIDLKNLSLSNNVTYDYDKTKLNIKDNIITPLDDGNYNLIINDIDNNIIINYQIEVIDNFVSVTDINLKLNEKTKLNFKFNDSKINYQIVYNKNDLEINLETLEIKALKKGLHALTIIDEYGFMTNILVNVTI